MSALKLSKKSPASLYDEARREAERHKWIESQKQGRDLGDQAIRDWFRVYWVIYCRCRRMEHVRGQRFWREFEEEAFSRLYSLIVAGDLLLDRILDRLDAGKENLDVIVWAGDWGLPVERVIEVLEQIDVNRAHLDPRP